MLYKKDGELKISDRNILQEALSKLHCSCREPIKDKYGVIGYDIGQYILVAKPMLFNGSIVSCHKNKIVFRAIQSVCKILFYISAHNCFYWFEPVEILNHPESFLNRRKTITMINFPIELGHRISPIDVLEGQLTLFK